MYNWSFYSKISLAFFKRLHLVIVCRGDKKDDNDGALVYVGIFLTRHNPFLAVDKL